MVIVDKTIRRYCMMELNSQRVRGLAPENDPLKIGMGWTVEDLDKPQIMVRTTFLRRSYS